jgi:hypothetical protein
MAEKPKDDKPTQETPTGHTIPVPSREQVLRDFERVAKARTKRPVPKRKPKDRP